MSARMLPRIWYADTPPPWPLRALTPLYAALLRLRRWLYARGALRRTRLPVPVVVVGNITAGGTGKTPLVLALAEGLYERGLRAGIISRGYGGSARGPLRVGAASDPAEVGDEACLMARAGSAPVAIARERAAAGRLLLDNAALDVLVADDGLQHFALCRDVEICVIDGARRLGNGRLLPAGPLREPARRLAEVDFVVCNGGQPGDGEVAMKLGGDLALALAGDGVPRRLADFAGSPVHAVAGIGNPQRFFAQLRAAGLQPIEHAFADHHAFVRADIEFDDRLAVLMTAKDAVKCVGFADARHWYVPVRAELPDAFFAAVAARVRVAAQELRST
jgi:tetraacyldisaccharide 4'-kinase